MTKYIAAYDTEKAGDCLVACREIRAVHERFGYPATFFIVGKRIEEEPDFVNVLGDCPLFEIASHTYSHRMLRDHPFCGPAVSDEDRLLEIRRSRELVEQALERPCVGLRPGCGFPEGLRGDPWLVNAVFEAGYRYVSSLAWGPEYSLPALFERPFTYADDGSPGLWELPAHGWHENVLKAHNLTTSPKRILLWPPIFPEGVVNEPIETPEEEFALNKVFIDRAVELDLPYISLIWHPWSLGLFDPAMKMLDLTFAYVRELGLEATTFEAEYARLSS
jgi:peptidoglycan/xylan/chitin deacetylase (PgdA/CDA1 family)